MKRIITLVILCMFTVSLKAQYDTIIYSFPYFEGFEDVYNWTGVSAYDMDSSAIKTNWVQDYGDPDFAAHSGKGFVYSKSTFTVKNDSNVYSLDSVDNWLVLPSFSVPAKAIGINFSFYITALEDIYFAEHYEIMISTEGSSPKYFDPDAVYAETLDTFGWERRQFDLSAYAGDIITIAIRHRQGYGLSGIAIDDISLQVAIPCEAVTTFPYVESFEDSTSCWFAFSEADPDAIEGSGWQIYNQTYQLGKDNSGVALSFSAATVNTDHWLISPALFLLPNADRITLSWWVRNGSESLPAEHYKVYVGEHTRYSELRGDSIVFSQTLNSSFSKWQQNIVDLTAFSGRIVHVAFRHCATNAQVALRIDDVRVDITGGSPIIDPNDPDEGVAQVATPHFALQPNPASNFVTIVGGTVETVQIYNTLGHLVVKQQGNATIDISPLSKGVYTMLIRTPQGTSAQQLVKK